VHTRWALKSGFKDTVKNAKRKREIAIQDTTNETKKGYSQTMKNPGEARVTAKVIGKTKNGGGGKKIYDSGPATPGYRTG